QKRRVNMRKIQEWLFVKMWNFQRWIITIHVDIYPNSPLYDANSEIKAILFNKVEIKLDTFKTPMTKTPGKLDINFIFVAFPNVNTIKVHYPENWTDLLDKVEDRTNE